MLRGVWELQREKGKRYDEDLRNTLMENSIDIHSPVLQIEVPSAVTVDY